MQFYGFRAMTTEIQLGAAGDPKFVEDGFKAVTAWIRSCEQRFTRFTDSSELAEFNRSDGRWVSVSADMFDLLAEAYDLVERTQGLFDPSILPDLINAGYDRSIEMIRQPATARPDPVQPNQAQAFPALATRHLSFTSARLEPKDRSVRLQPGMRLDLGGVAKGWMAERAAHKLAAYANSVAVDIGGDLFLLGEAEDAPDWEIGLEDPREPATDLAILHVKAPVAVATSSVVKRRWTQSQATRHHIIDPRTGEPADTDWLCVTAIAPHGAQAEAFAKSLLIAGSKEAGEVSQGLAGLAYIGVDQSGHLWGSENSQELLHVTEK